MMDIQNGEHRDRKNVKLFDMDVNGNYVFVSVINSDLRKECPNCYNFFVKSENMCCIHQSDRKFVRFYKCPACGCRIKMCN